MKFFKPTLVAVALFAVVGCQEGAKKEEVKEVYDIDLIDEVYSKKYDVIVLAVAHKEFKNIDIVQLKNKEAVVYDIKNFLAIKDKSL